MKIHVRATLETPSLGIIDWTDPTGPHAQYRCALGRSGIQTTKQEGDGVTPAGTWQLLRVLFRPDRLPEPATALPVQALTPSDGWCDDPKHPAYNQPVSMPFPASHEALWRDDHVYDVIVVLDHNSAPPVPGHGSAIFLHVAQPNMQPTEGCIALPLADLLSLLAACQPGDVLDIQAP